MMLEKEIVNYKLNFDIKSQPFKENVIEVNTILRLVPNDDVKHKVLTEINLTALVTIDRSKLDLRDQIGVKKWLEKEKPSIIIIAAAKVGGIFANSTQPADFLYDNLVIETNIIKAAHEIEVKKLLFLGSSCIYPRDAKQPMVEEELLTGPLEKTNESYAIAKIAGIKLCEAYRTQYGCDFISAQPTNLYGEGDKFDPEMGHVIPALMVKAHKGKINNYPKGALYGLVLGTSLFVVLSIIKKRTKP